MAHVAEVNKHEVLGAAFAKNPVAMLQEPSCSVRWVIRLICNW